MNDFELLQTRPATGALLANKVIRNTYLLLSLTLLVSAAASGLTLWLQLGRGAALLLLLVGFGLSFWVQRAADSAQGLIAVFAFTACMGAALGPTIGWYLKLPNGPLIVLEALAATAVVFLTLSAYALVTKRDFSFMGGFLLTGLVVVSLAGLVNLFLHIPLVSLTLPALVALLMSAMILFDTSRIVNGGETNYIRATVSLYLDLYNLFTSLLQLLGRQR